MMIKKASAFKHPCATLVVDLPTSMPAKPAKVQVQAGLETGLGHPIG